MLYDLYLFSTTKNQFIKIPKLSYSEADKLGKKWVLNTNTDYILVMENSTPWENEPNIIVADRTFVDTYGGK